MPTVGDVLCVSASQANILRFLEGQEHWSFQVLDSSFLKEFSKQLPSVGSEHLANALVGFAKKNPNGFSLTEAVRYASACARHERNPLARMLELNDSVCVAAVEEFLEDSSLLVRARLTAVLTAVFGESRNRRLSVDELVQLALRASDEGKDPLVVVVERGFASEASEESQKRRVRHFLERFRTALASEGFATRASLTRTRAEVK